MIEIPESKKSKRIIEKEEEWGINVEEALRRLYVDENLHKDEMASRLGISKLTIEKYMKLAHIFSRRLKI